MSAFELKAQRISISLLRRTRLLLLLLLLLLLFRIFALLHAQMFEELHHHAQEGEVLLLWITFHE